MRKLLLKSLSLVPIFAAGITMGQGLPNVYQSPVNGNQCKVEYDVSSRNHIIFSDPYGSYNHFSLTDITNSTIDVRQPSSYVISDFEIFEGYVIFCGHTFANEGLIGWFKINDFFTGLQSAYVDHTLTVLGLSDLADIEVYRDANNYVHIAGIGSSSTATPNMGFEAVGTFPLGMKYRVAQFWSNVYDLTVTDNYVVFAGEYDIRCIILYSFPKNDIFLQVLIRQFCFSWAQQFMIYKTLHHLRICVLYIFAKILLQRFRIGSNRILHQLPCHLGICHCVHTMWEPPTSGWRMRTR